MKRLVLLLALSVTAFGAQVFRVDPPSVVTTAGNAPFGGNPALYAVAGATVSICTDAACSIPATTYTDATGNTTCPVYAPVTLAGTVVCTSQTGQQGQFGFWVTPGTYYYKIVTPNGQTFGNFPLTSNTAGVTQLAGGSGISVTNGGIGSVTINNTGVLSFNGRTGAVVPQQTDYFPVGSQYQVFQQGAAGALSVGPLHLDQPAAVTGLLPISDLTGLLPTANGGTGVASPAQHSVPVSAGASPMNFTAPGTIGNLFLSNGPTADPSFQPLSAALPSGQKMQVLQVDPNGVSTTNFRFNPLALNNANDFNFTAQSPGGSLSSGISNSVTLSPCPLGVNNTDSGHYLYVSGGTGTAEPVLITGGTCTSGAGSGTVVFTPNNAHTGAWTISSATAGIQEALQYGNSVYLPPGSYTTHGTITPPSDSSIIGPGLEGQANTNAVIALNANNIPAISLIHENVRISGVGVRQASGVAAVSGSVGILANNISTFDLEHMDVHHFFYGIEYTNAIGGSVNLHHISTFDNVSHGIYFTGGGQGFWEGITSTFNGGDGAHLGTCTGNGAISPWISGYQSFNNGGWGMYVCNETANIGGAMSSLNNDFAGGLYIKGVLNPSQVSNVQVVAEGQSTSWGNNTTAPGIELDYGTTPAILNNITVGGSNGNGIVITNASQVNGPHQLNNVWTFGNGGGLVAGNTYDLLANNSLLLQNAVFGSPVKITGANGTVLIGNKFTSNTASIPTLLITGSSANVTLSGNTINNIAAGSTGLQCDAGSTLSLSSNAIIAPVGQVNNCALASGATQTIPYGNGNHFTTASATNDVAGTCTFAATTCTVTFGNAYNSPPACVANDLTTAAPVRSSPNTTNVIFTGGTGAGATDLINYICMGRPF